MSLNVSWLTETGWTRHSRSVDTKKQRRIGLKKESLRQLSTADLRVVIGGQNLIRPGASIYCPIPAEN